MSLREIEERILAAGCVWWFLDYDGTLNEFAPTPELIEPNPEVVQLLKNLAGVPGYRVTIISGRPMSALELLLPVTGIEMAGTYGWEKRNLDGQLQPIPELQQLRPVLQELIPTIEEMIAQRTGFYLEDKGSALALHGRTASAEDVEVVMSAVESRFLAAAQNVPLVVESGNRFLEIFPSAARKRSFVRMAFEPDKWPGCLPVYIGDDRKDESAFEEIHAKGGIALRVLYDQVNTRADGSFKNPAEVRAFLHKMAMRS